MNMNTQTSSKEIMIDIVNHRNIRNARDSLSKGERSALKQLKNSNVTIRIQDKGSRFVSIDSTEYKSKMLGQLDDIRYTTNLHSLIPLPSPYVR